MRCPFCGAGDSRVLDSRPAEAGNAVRRRRECGTCAKRFTTYERVDEPRLLVIKKDGRREAFDRGKILAGMAAACRKRPVSTGTLENLAAEVEQELLSTPDREVRSRDIGELVVNRLHRLDRVAHIRFVSVYREFADVREFIREIERGQT